MPTPQDLAQQFLEHFNNHDTSQLLSLVDDDMRYNGRSGDGHGVHLLREWIDRASTSMVPVRWFGDDAIAVVEVDITWRKPGSDTITDSAKWGIAFAVDNDKISSISRYADVGEAVTKMGLMEDDTLPEAGFPMPGEE